mmetsp:Transcript_94167/g.265920  ORF Transcript_94167/g.265920 Transcript_94167/m.265920 type:complete len:219 (-) Transcript_94167:155-811(-)
MGVGASGQTSEAFKTGLHVAAMESSKGDLKAMFDGLPSDELAKLRAAIQDLKTPRPPQAPEDAGEAAEKAAPNDTMAENKAEEPASTEETDGKEAKAESTEEAPKKEDEATAQEVQAEASVDAKAEAKKAGLTDVQIENVMKSFKAIDTDGSNAIEEAELRGVMKAIDVEATDAEVSTVLKNIDADGNGKLDPDEYLKMVASALKGSGPETVALPPAA